MNGAGRFVVDASVGVKWVLPEDDSRQAQSLLSQAVLGRAQLLAPDVYVGESANAVWRRCRLRREIDDDEARDAVSELRRTLPDLTPASELVEQAFELSLQFHRPIHDCLYVALAIREGCPLVTADRRLFVEVAPAIGTLIFLPDLRLGF